MKLHPLHPATNVIEAFSEAGFQVKDLLAFTRRSTVFLIETEEQPQVVKAFFGSDHVLDQLDEEMRPAAYGFYWYNSQSEEARKFEKEAVESEISITSQMSGEKGWPRIVDKGVVDGIPFLQMDRISGQKFTLPTRPDRDTVKKRIKWLADVAYALERLHIRGFVHRDVYHENVLVSDDGACVIDLGLARSINIPSGPRIRGPEVHWPPEYLDDYSSAGPPADIYGLGVLIHRTLTGDMPRIQSPEKLASVATPKLLEMTLGCLSAIPRTRPDAKTVAQLFDEANEH